MPGRQRLIGHHKTKGMSAFSTAGLLFPAATVTARRHPLEMPSFALYGLFMTFSLLIRVLMRGILPQTTLADNG